MTDFRWFEGSHPNRREFVAPGLRALAGREPGAR